ncbi:MAG: hypothetical protein U1E13_03165 [Methylophilaceae bacterium]|nr:hypothetical protein [Erythrobacter sp.]MDZ4097683.1 hypothetical protein [Methylophilaceae bacterium]MDZ4271915.1 hypothetical protein [Erythrobacter sp.]MDZ4275957.1 hypothetical protein [Erythrobacter sp.]
MIHIAEMAHVFAATDGGPRSNPKLSLDERGAFENLILLCVACHTIIDKAPNEYPDHLILNWKSSHAAKLIGLFGSVEYENRQNAYNAIESLMIENKSIFDGYGPRAEAAWNPESGVAERWKRKVLTKVIPNNRRILATLDVNRRLLSEAERGTVEAFRQHIDDLEARHIEGFSDGASQYPQGMTNILRS